MHLPRLLDESTLYFIGSTAGILLCFLLVLHCFQKEVRVSVCEKLEYWGLWYGGPGRRKCRTGKVGTQHFKCECLPPNVRRKGHRASASQACQVEAQCGRAVLRWLESWHEDALHVPLLSSLSVKRPALQLRGRDAVTSVCVEEGIQAGTLQLTGSRSCSRISIAIGSFCL